MRPPDLHTLLDEAVTTAGAEQVKRVLQALIDATSPEPATLTIIANAGVHEIPTRYLRGEVYEASRGDWQVSTAEALAVELRGILLRLASKLRSRAWGTVYLVPTGHPVLSLQIKTMVYRVLRINSIDLYYKAGSYFEVNIDQRAVALECPMTGNVSSQLTAAPPSVK